MMNVIPGEKHPIKVWTDPSTIEDSALQQLKNLARLPFIGSNGIAVMPDVHAGIGSTVGTVIATRKAVLPAAVGVDIGCGMCAVRTSLKASDLPDNLAPVRHQIERDVPVGFNAYKRESDIQTNWSTFHSLVNDWNDLVDKTEYRSDFGTVSKQLGTLGGGNHFIEICLDENQDVWIMLHSGSRGTGNQIGRYFIDRAKELCERWHVDLPHQDLAYLPQGDKVFDEYIQAVTWAQEYAKANRAVMLERVCSALGRTVKPFYTQDEAVNCHHNYVALENHHNENLYVTRKGAISAREGQLGIIPGSMGQRSYIVRGKGNMQSYCSCSHGAGRVMSRTQAKKHFTLADLVAQTQGVECRKDEGVIDEIPGAYKDIDQVMANQTDLVEVEHTLKQVLCVKG